MPTPTVKAATSALSSHTSFRPCTGGGSKAFAAAVRAGVLAVGVGVGVLDGGGGV